MDRLLESATGGKPDVPDFLIPIIERVEEGDRFKEDVKQLQVFASKAADHIIGAWSLLPTVRM